MKPRTTLFPIVFAALCGLATSVLADATVLERGPHYNLVQNQVGDRYFEMASGFNFLQNSVWTPSVEQIETAPDGAVFRQGAFSAIWNGNINTSNAIDVLTMDSLRFRSTLYGVALYSPSAQKTVLLGQLQDSFGQLTAPNTVLYPDAWSGLIRGHVRYTVKKSGLEQDVVLTGLTAALAQTALEMNAAGDCEIQVISEFFTPPAPTITAVGGGLTNSVTGSEFIQFGSMHLGRGKAFLSLPGAEELFVKKLWVTLPDGSRTFLVESVPLARMAGLLSQLPVVADANPPPPVLPVSGSTELASIQTLVSQPERRRSAKVSTPIRTAQWTPAGKELVWDWVLQVGTANVTFSAGTTFYVSGPLTLTGTAVFESAVLKFAPTNSAGIQLNCVTDCRTAQFRAAILTARDDDTVGAVISGSTGSPSGYYAYRALSDNAYGPYLLHDLRISYAQTGLYAYYDNGGPQLYNGQILNCSNAVTANYAMIGLKNVLINNATTALAGTSPLSAFFDQVTFDHCLNLAGGSGNAYFTNCIMANVTNLLASGGSLSGAGAYNGFYNCPTFGSSTVSSGSNPFQTVLAGAHYLAPGSVFLSAGTTGVNPIALTALKTRTTFPPVLLSSPVSLNTTLGPQAPRGYGTPSLGYSYDPIDYLISNLVVTGAVFCVTNGAALGFYGTNGIILQSNSQLVSQGSPLAMNEFCQASFVQENTSSAYGNGTVYTILEDDPAFGSGTQIFLRFTEAAINGVSEANTNATGAFFAGNGNLSLLALQDSALYGARIAFTNASTSTTFAATNTLFEHPYLTLGNGSSSSIVAYARNNLFVKNGWITLAPSSGNSWGWYDNQFDVTNIAQNANSIANDYNAYINGAPRLTSNGAHDQVLSSFNYVVGPCGWYYQPTSSALIDAGSRTADQAGLYEFTTQLSEAKETTSTVDIGLHYVALQAASATNAWVDDAVPSGATAYGDSDGWNWVSSSPSPYSGTKSHQSALAGGEHQHYFQGATTTLVLGKGDSLFTYVYIDAANVPSQLLLQFHDDYYWNHRAYWGTAPPVFGTDGTDTGRYMGAMPATGQWVRLDIAELAAGLRGVNLSGMAFTLDNGRATWDYTGKAALVPVDSNGYGIPDYLEDVNGNGTLSPGNVTLNWQTPDGGLIGTAAIQVFGRGPVPGGSSTGRSCRRPQP